ncbi:XdhC family protein [Planktotalea sp.]|uniref:XdhC family protein n=1 Tax=Planktotalea sp. TaxID=2029877 RepID=UPI0032970D1F
MNLSKRKSISLAEHPSDIIAHAAVLIGQGKRFALITSVGIEGGAAREVGSLAVIDASGDMVGYLSNGCIDKDIQLHALDALESDSKKLIRYGDGSQFADLKLPCGGALSVLIDPNPDREALLRLHRAFEARGTGALSFDIPEPHRGIAPRVRFEYRPQVRLVLAGRGAIFRAMAEVGHSIGFQICCLSPDQEDLEAVSEVCHLAPVHLVSPRQEISMTEVDAHSAVLTLFHDHDWEPELLRAAVRTPAQYIGCLGSRRTHQARLDHLQFLGVSAEDRARLHGPIGLVPSLRDAPLIAVSALSELVSHFSSSISESATSEIA